MLSLARTSLGLLALALIAPINAGAQDVSPSAPSGYQPYVAAPAPAGPVAQPAPAAPAPVQAPHKHKGRTICANCAAKQAQMAAMPPGKIVGCAHSKNGVCSACQAALNMPGQFVVMGGPAPAPAPAAPGRAVASSAPAG